MSSHCYRFQFAEDVVRDDVETAFLLTLTAVESLHGDAATRLNVRHAFDAEGLGVVIDAGTSVGCDLAKLFTGFLLRALAEDEFSVRRIDGDSHPSSRAA